MAANLPRDEERRIADALRTSLEAFEEKQRRALAELKNDLVAALWPADEDDGYEPAKRDEEGTQYG